MITNIWSKRVVLNGDAMQQSEVDLFHASFEWIERQFMGALLGRVMKDREVMIEVRMTLQDKSVYFPLSDEEDYSGLAEAVNAIPDEDGSLQ